MTRKLTVMEQVKALQALRASHQSVDKNRQVLIQSLSLVHQPPTPPKRPVPGSPLSQGLRDLVDRPFLQRVEYHSQQQRAVRDGAHPDVREFERKFVKRMAKKHGVPLFAHNMVRTEADQTALFVKGVTKARAGQSPHNFGCAVDIVHSVMAWDLSQESWTLIGHIGKELAHSMGIKLVWGGDWSFYDPAHWELADWRSKKGGFPF